MEKVINCFKKRPDAVTRLICFPWAGGGSIHYARWGNVLSSSIEGNTPGGCQVLCIACVLFALYLCSQFVHELQNDVLLLWNQNPEVLLHFEMYVTLPVSYSVCCETSWQRDSSQRALLSEHAADCGWSCWSVVTCAERQAVCTVWPQVWKQ